MSRFTSGNTVSSKRGTPKDFSAPGTPSKRDRPAGKGGASPKGPLSKGDDPSIFDILNTFRHRWFLSRTHLLTHVISAQKDESGNISWAEFDPSFQCYLVKCAIALAPHPHPVPKVKRVMFGYILELLEGEGHNAFFDLQKGGRKVNNAQKEKKRPARKRSHAAKRERERKVAKAAQLPLRMRQSVACGRKFESRKTSKKHECPKSNVVDVAKEVAGGQASQAKTPAKVDKPSAPITSHAPPAPLHSHGIPVVIGDSQDNNPTPMETEGDFSSEENYPLGYIISPEELARKLRRLAAGDRERNVKYG